MTNISVDVVVIGSGPGGEGAAIQLSKGGKKVVVIEKDHNIGGGCTHYGTIPSKALRFAIHQLTDAMSNPMFREFCTGSRPNFQELRKSAQSVIEKQESLRRRFYLRNDIEVIQGHARFSGPNKIIVNDEVITAKHFVLATGSRPYRPDTVDFGHARIFDSDTILGLKSKPKTMTIYGAGVVGCEYASMFRNLDVKINLINNRSHLLDFLDDEISDALGYHMRDQGVVIRHDEDFGGIQGVDDGVIVSLQSGKQLKTDIVLWAAGRTGNSDQLGLESIEEISPDSRGYLAVNEFFQTSIPGIFAVGDVIGFPSLASAAYTQGRAAANKILENERDFCALASEIPSGIYTSPEISCIGKTEKELTESKTPYEVGVSHFKHLARAQIIGQTVGMLKILFHSETLEILGVHCFGANAAEIVHIGQAVMSQEGDGNSLRYFMNSTFNYPTMAEAYRVAALNGYNRLF